MSKDKNNLYLFIKRPNFAIVISLVIVLAGIISVFGLPLEDYPSITPPQVTVSANYPGANAEVVESTIAAPLEAQINGVENMTYMTSNSQDGSYSLTVYFAIGTDPNLAMINVQNRVQLATPRLPQMVRNYGLTVNKSVSGPGLLLVSLYSPHNTYDSLYIANYASIYVKDELSRIPGISTVNVFGSSDYSMRIWLNAQKMANLGISADEVSNAIATQNTQVPAGEIGVEPLTNKQMIKLTLRTKGRLKDVSEFENIVIKSKSSGSQVLLKDIARVELGAQSYSYFGRSNGTSVALLSIKQLPEANSIALAKKIKQRIAQLSKSFPPGLVYQVDNDETIFIRQSMDEVVHSIVLAIILVVIVTFCFLGSMRASIVPFCAIPVSLLGTFIAMSMLGFSINLLILFGLVLAVGLVVDDAIVVLENVQRHIQQGMSPLEAANLTMKEVFGAVVATSLVLMAVFVPVCFLGGVTGRMYQQFAMCIATSIALSTIVALSLSPALCSRILKSKEEFKEAEFLIKFDNWFNKIRDKYLIGSKYFIENKKQTLMLFGLMILLIFILLKLIQPSFLPEDDRGIVFTQVQLPDGSSASRSDMVAKQVESYVQKIKGVKTIITMVGFNGENTALVIARLDDWSKRKKASMTANGILQQIRQHFGGYPGATVVSFLPPAISGLGMFGGFEYQLLDKGERNPNELYDLASKFIIQANQDPKLQSVYTQYTANLPQLMVDVNISKALAQNVSINEIYDTLAAQFGTTYVNDFNKYGRVFRVMMQGDEDFRTKVDDIDKVFVKNNAGKMVPLKSVVDIRDVVGPYSLTRFNMYPAVTINGSAASGISSGEAMNEMEKLSAKYLPKDTSFAWSGMSLQEKDSGGQLGGILVMALTFVYLFLVALYESWMLPFAVMLIAPVAIVGGLLFQYVCGYSLDIYSQIGLIMLVGMSTKQAILIIEFAKEARENNNLTAHDAAMEAAKLRFRAVMMTAIAFILGVLPLVFASGAGAASRHSVGMTVFGGMIAVAFVGTLLVPAFYVIIEDAQDKFKTRFLKK